MDIRDATHVDTMQVLQEDTAKRVTTLHNVNVQMDGHVDNLDSLLIALNRTRKNEQVKKPKKQVKIVEPT